MVFFAYISLLNSMKYHKHLAELIGTYLLTLSVLLSVYAGTGSIVATAVIAGTVLMTCVYTIGNVSGSHINPAVTLSLMSGGKISTKDAVHYIIFQCIGALLAALTYYKLTGSEVPYMVDASFDWMVFATEALGALFFLFGISAVVWGKVNDAMHGIVVGVSLFIGIMLAAHAGGMGIINPAVALGVSSLDFATLLGPIVGGIVGVHLYKIVVNK